MINAGQAFADAVAQSSRRFRMRIFYGLDEIEGSVRQAKIHLGSTGPETFSIGAVYSAYAEITLDGRNTTLEGKELKVEAGVLAGSDYADITLGYFTALAPAATKYRTTFTAVGRISAVLAVTDISITETVTLQQLAARINTLTGINILFESGIDTSETISHPISGNCRDALAVLAQVCGGFATETNTGNILISRYKDTPTAEYGPDTMTALPEMAEYDFEITGMQALTQTGTFESGSPVNVSIESNYITESSFAQIARNLIGFSYRPGTAMLALGDPRIEPTDVLTITTPDNDEYTVPCMAVTHIFDGGFQTEISTPAVQMVGEVIGTTGVAVKEAMKEAEKASEEAGEARKVAVNYLSRDHTGIMIANMADGNVYTPSTVPPGVKNAFIDNDSFDVRNGDTVLATFGEQSQIGKSTGRNIQLTNSGFKVRNGSTVLADFGAVTTIGPENGIHISINPVDGSLSILNGQNIITTLWFDETSSKGNIEADYANLYTIDTEEITVGGRVTGVVSVFNNNGRMIQLKSQSSNNFTGLYEESLSKWLIYADGDGECNIPKVFSNLVVDKSVKTPQASAFVEVISSDGNGEAAGDIALYASFNGRCGLYQRSAGKWMIYNELGTRIPDLNFSDTGSGTVGSNYTAAPFKTCQLTKVGRIVSMQMSLGFSSGTNTLAMNDTLFTLPSGFRPFSNTKVPCMMIRGTGYMPYPGHVKVSSNGVITQDESNNVTGIYCFAQWETS